MSVSVRDVSGTPILPVIEHFGGNTAEEEQDAEEGKDGSRRSRRAAGFPPATAVAAATPEGGRAPRKQGRDEGGRPQGRRQGGAVERTFLDRSPPPECVEAVLHKGCTARKISAVAACLVLLVRNRDTRDRGQGGEWFKRLVQLDLMSGGRAGKARTAC